jgi:hypothetical protein
MGLRLKVLSGEMDPAKPKFGSLDSPSLKSEAWIFLEKSARPHSVRAL